MQQVFMQLVDERLYLLLLCEGDFTLARVDGDNLAVLCQRHDVIKFETLEGSVLLLSEDSLEQLDLQSATRINELAFSAVDAGAGAAQRFDDAPDANDPPDALDGAASSLEQCSREAGAGVDNGVGVDTEVSATGVSGARLPEEMPDATGVAAADGEMQPDKGHSGANQLDAESPGAVIAVTNPVDARIPMRSANELSGAGDTSSVIDGNGAAEAAVTAMSDVDADDTAKVAAASGEFGGPDVISARNVPDAIEV